MLRPSKLKFILCTVLLLFSANLQAQNNETAPHDSLNVFDDIIMERVMVIGSPESLSRIPGSASYISRKKLQEQSYTDINRVLRGVSGVNIQEEDGFGLRPNISLRGAGSERSTKVNIMEDGMLMAPAPYSAPAAYYFPNISRMSSVEVRKGSSQIKYGPNTTGGAINLISTRIPFEFSGTAEVSMGQNSSNRIYTHVGNSSRNFGFMIEGLHMQNDGFKTLDSGGNTGFRLNDFMGKFMARTNHDASVYQRIEIKLGYNDEISDETYLGLSRDDFTISPFRRYAASQADRMVAEHLHGSIRHFAQFSENMNITTTVYRNNFSREWYKLQAVNGTGLSAVLNNPEDHSNSMEILRGRTSGNDALVVRSNNRDYFSHGAESILSWGMEDGDFKNWIELGVRIHQDEEDRFQLEDGYRMQDGVMIRTDAGSPGTQSNRVGSATALSLFLQDQISYDRWTFTPGIRFEYTWFEDRNYGRNDPGRTGADLNQHAYNVHVFVPGIGVTYRLNDQFSLITGIHKGFSPPSPGSDRDTRPESSVNYEAGFRYDNGLVLGEVIGFFNDYRNLLGSDLAAGGGGGTTAQFNAGEVKVFGVEASVLFDLADWLDTPFTLPFNANYTFTNATFRSDFESSFGPWGTVKSGDQLPFIPRHQLNAGISLNYGDFSLHLNTFSTAKMRTAAGSGAITEDSSTDSYILLDAGSSYQITEALSAFVNVRNLLDETYIVSDRPAGLRPGLPRTLLGGMRITL